jgi:hypothetical protein
VNRAANAVSGESGDDGETPATDLAIDGAPDFVDTYAGASDRQRGFKCRGRAGHQAMRGVRTRFDDNAARRIGHVTVLFNRHVDLDDVASAYAAAARNSVNDLIVDADQDGAREPVDERRSGARAVCGEQLGCLSIELTRRYAGP